MVFQTGDCTFNRDVFANFSVQVQNGHIMLDMNLIKVLSFGLKGRVTVEFRMSKTKNYQKLYHTDHDYCALLKGTQNTLARRWFLSVLKTSNFVTSCPIQPNKYYIRGWKVDGNLIPSFLSFGNYRFEGILYFGKYKKNTINPLLRCITEAILT